MRKIILIFVVLTAGPCLGGWLAPLVLNSQLKFRRSGNEIKAQGKLIFSQSTPEIAELVVEGTPLAQPIHLDFPQIALIRTLKESGDLLVEARAGNRVGLTDSSALIPRIVRPDFSRDLEIIKDECLVHDGKIMVIWNFILPIRKSEFIFGIKKINGVRTIDHKTNQFIADGPGEVSLREQSYDNQPLFSLERSAPFRVLYPTAHFSVSEGLMKHCFHDGLNEVFSVFHEL
jgi:hypothetical protein